MTISGISPCSRNSSPIRGAFRRPRSLSGRSWSSSAGSFQLDFACLSTSSVFILRKLRCLISDQHRDVADLVTGIGVAVRFGDLVERVSTPDDGPRLARVDQLLQEDEIGLLRVGRAGDESRPSGEVYYPASHQRACHPRESP